MAKTEVLTCPRCRAKIRVSIRDGEISILSYEKEVAVLDDLEEI